MKSNKLQKHVEEKLLMGIGLGLTENEACLFAEVDGAQYQEHKKADRSFQMRLDRAKIEQRIAALTTLDANLSKPEVAMWFLSQK